MAQQTLLSVIQRTLCASIAENVVQFEDALEQIWTQHNQCVALFKDATRARKTSRRLVKPVGSQTHIAICAKPANLPYALRIQSEKGGYCYSVIVTTDMGSDLTTLLFDYDARGGVPESRSEMSICVLYRVGDRHHWIRRYWQPASKRNFALTISRFFLGLRIYPHDIAR